MAYHGGYNPTEGYDMSANAFVGNGGAGYMHSPTTVDSTSSDFPSAKKGRSGITSQSLQPVTIRQLFYASQAHPDDVFKIDGRDINQISVVGIIESIAEQSTHITLVIDDGTAIMEARFWVDADEHNEYTAQKRAAWSEGIYVRVIGHLRSFMNKRSIVAFRIQPLKDFNELTYHFLEVLYVHLVNTKGPLPSSTVSTVPNTHSYSHTPMVPSVASDQLKFHKDVFQVIKNYSVNERGTSIHQICAALRDHSEEEIRKAVEFLTNEGHLYSTINEDHFKTTSNILL